MGKGGRTEPQMQAGHGGCLSNSPVCESRLSSDASCLQKQQKPATPTFLVGVMGGMDGAGSIPCTVSGRGEVVSEQRSRWVATGRPLGRGKQLAWPSVLLSHLVWRFQHLHQEGVDGRVPYEFEEEEMLQALQADGPEGREAKQQLGEPRIRGRGVTTVPVHPCVQKETVHLPPTQSASLHTRLPEEGQAPPPPFSSGG